MPSIESIEKATGITYHFILIIAAMAAGSWALFEFNASRLESLNLSLDAKVIEQQADQSAIVSIKVKVKNPGNQNVFFQLSDQSVIATKLVFDKNSEIKKQGAIYYTGMPTAYRKDDVYFASSIKISPQSERELAFYLKLETPGLYHIEFIAYRRGEKRAWHTSNYLRLTTKLDEKPDRKLPPIG